MAHYEKLVRDKIPEILNRKGVAYDMRIATDDEYRTELIRKLGEEVREFTEAGAIEELADVLEVIEAIQAFPEFISVKEVQRQKREERGGFTERRILSGDDGK